MFHGAPKGYAQPLYAPGTFIITPMQISTNDGSGRKSGAGGMLPRIKLPGGRTPADPSAQYSPLLECPCTTRMVINGTAGTINGNFMNGDCTRDEPLSDLLVTKNHVQQILCRRPELLQERGLLDADQVPPAFTDEVFFRFRFYFEDYAGPSKHQHLEHVEWASMAAQWLRWRLPRPLRAHRVRCRRGVGSTLGRDVQVFQSTYRPGWLASSCSETSAAWTVPRSTTPRDSSS